jgi:hypothetical protein
MYMDPSPDRPVVDVIPGVELPPFGRFNGLQVHFAEELIRSHPLGSEVNVRELAVKSLPLLEVARQRFRDNFPDVLAAIMRVAATDRRMAEHLSGLTPRELSCAFAMVELAVHFWRADASSQSIPIAPDGDSSPAVVSLVPEMQRRPLVHPLQPVD